MGAHIQPRSYKPGDQVKIREGPFSGLDAIFEREMKGIDQVAVLLDLLGRQTRIVLAIKMIGRL
ncbi:MAG: hypothetical protein A2038_11645 [Deltaproteobacteria bacterium GWA2_57_13]|nr:MAG: hypothetical protein A2038_11645 [Deltaproteobacteria bacterium GWA2_57_13]